MLKIRTRDGVLMWTCAFAALSMGIFRLCNHTPGMEADSLRYLLPIHNFFEGKGYTFEGIPQLLFPPGYGILAYPFFLITGDVEYSGMLASLFCYVMIVPATYYVAQKLFGEGCGLVSAFFVATTPKLLEMSISCLTEMPFCLFFMLCLWLYLEHLDGGGWLKSVLLGAGLAFVYLLRPEGFLIAVLALPTLLFLQWQKIKSDAEMFHAGTLLKPCAAIAAFAICAAPYVVFLHEHSGRWTFSGKGAQNLIAGETWLQGANYRAEDSGYPDYSQGFSYVEYIHSRGWNFVLRIVRNVIAEVFYLFRITAHALFPLGLLWLLYPFVAPGRLFPNATMSGETFRVALTLALFLSPLMVYPLFFIAERFLLPYALLILILLAFLTTSFWTRISESLGRPLLRSGLVALVLVSTVYNAALAGVKSVPRLHHMQHLPSSVYTTLTATTGPWGLRTAGEWLRDHCHNVNELSIVAPMMGEVALFYAAGKKEPSGKAYSIPPGFTVDQVVADLKKHPDRVLLLEDMHGKLEPFWPELVPLWTNPAAAQQYGLSRVYEDKEGLFMIFRLADVQDRQCGPEVFPRTSE